MARHRPLGPGLLLFTFALAGVVALVLWARLPPEAPGPDHLGRHVLLETRAALREDGTEFVFVLREASRVWIRVGLPEGQVGHGLLGLPAAAGAKDIAYVPTEGARQRFDVTADSPEHETILMSPGTYVVRVQPEAQGASAGRGAGADGASIVVRARRLRDEG